MGQHGLMEIPSLPDTAILMVEVGSTAHGTGIAGGEDHDQLAVVVETPEQVLGLDEHGLKTVMQRTQPEGVRSGPGDTDRTLHSLRRFVRLAASGNPSILMTMWAPVEFSTPIGEELRGLGEAFVGRHVVPRYRGYMQSQARRLLGLSGGGHGRRGGGGREELISEFGYDTKYAMHCARLGFQCLELLRTGGLELPIQGEPADWLRAVRYGQVEFDQWWERSLELDAQLEAIGEDASIREGPDRERIDAWCVDAHRRVWAEETG
ncbi:MAG: nucleotidyltransferase [Sulfitobacter sp.]|nr:nucleotidyltransferase [Sulfitobacter sp.]